MTRCVVIVSDSGGCGALRDAGVGGASETHTIGSVTARVGGATLATRGSDACGLRLARVPNVQGTIIGHLEMTTIHTDVPFPTYRGGFPPAALAGLAAAGGVTVGKIVKTVVGGALAERALGSCVATTQDSLWM